MSKKALRIETTGGHIFDFFMDGTEAAAYVRDIVHADSQGITVLVVEEFAFPVRNIAAIWVAETLE